MKKKFLILLMVISMLLPVIPINRVYAKDNSTEFMTFSQHDPRWCYEHYNPQVANTFGWDMSKESYNQLGTGCLVISNMILMAYANPDLRDFEKFNPPESAPKFKYVGAGLCYNGANAFDSTWVDLGQESCSSHEDAYNKIVSYMKKGEYCIINSHNGTHWMAVVGYDESNKTLTFQDPSNGLFNKWEDAVSAGSFTGFHHYKGKLPSYETLGKINGTSTEDAQKEQVDGYEIPREDQLRGMEKLKKYLLENQVELSVPDYEDLSQKEKNAIESIKTDIELRSYDFVDYIRIFILFVGLLIVLYGILLGIAALFDRTNIFFDFSLVSILTLHRLIYVTDISDVSDTSKFVTTKGIIKHIFVIELVGFIIVSGVGFTIGKNSIEYLNEFISYILSVISG